ncbi:MAG: hypothetical protein JWP01_3306 [Myxococcales bacterium]|nr:hypothetical protein [Myxococcales bacterium]
MASSIASTERPANTASATAKNVARSRNHPAAAALLTRRVLDAQVEGDVIQYTKRPMPEGYRVTEDV